MTDGVVQLAPNSTGAKIDTSELTVNGNTVERQRVVLADPTTASAIASVKSPGVPATGADSALVVAIRDILPTSVSDDGFLDLAAQDLGDGDGAGPGLITPAGWPASGNEPALVVALSPNSPMPIDPGVPLPAGGRTPQGGLTIQALGADGGTRLTDAPAPVWGQAGSVTAVTGWIDTTGYQSIVVTFTGPAATATATFQSTNDPSIPLIAGNAAGWPVAGAAAPAVTLANPTAGATWTFPVTGKFFRVYCSAWTSGVLGAVVQLRAAACPFIPSTPLVNVGQIGGTNTVAAAGVAGLLAVGGNIAAGVAPTAGPVYVAGLDTGGKTRPILTDPAGNPQTVGTVAAGVVVNTAAITTGTTIPPAAGSPVVTGGVDSGLVVRRVLVDQTGAPVVAMQGSTPATQSVPELLTQILGMLRVIAHYEYDNPLMIAMALNGTPMNPRSSGEEPDALLGYLINPANTFQNTVN